MKKTEIPVVVQAAAENSFWIENILDGIRAAATRHAYSLCFMDLPAAGALPADTPVLAVGYISGWLHNTIAVLQEKGCHPIAVNASVLPEMENGCSAVHFELEDGIRQIVRYLAHNKKEKIVLLGVNENSAADRLKQKAFLRYTAEHPLIQPEVVANENSLSACVDLFAENMHDLPCDAVLCANDTVGIYLMNALRKRGFKVPEDLFVIGIGNSNIGQSLHVALTSLEFDYVEMGRQAVRLWRFVQRGNTQAHVRVSLPCRLNIRESTNNIPFGCSLTNLPLETNVDSHYADAVIQQIIGIEAFLLSCDDLDREILNGVLGGETYEQMGDRLFMSDRGVKYRVSKMKKKLGLHHRSEISMLLRGLGMDLLE